MPDANDIAKEYERREREKSWRSGLQPPHPDRVKRTMGRLTINDDTTALCHVQIIGNLIVAEFADGGKGIYSLAPGDSAYFEPDDAGE